MIYPNQEDMTEDDDEQIHIALKSVVLEVLFLLRGLLVTQIILFEINKLEFCLETVVKY